MEGENVNLIVSPLAIADNAIIIAQVPIPHVFIFKHQMIDA